MRKTHFSSTEDGLADSIHRISAALEELRRSGLNEKAIIVLLVHKTKIGSRSIKTVIDAMRDLKKTYCS